MKYPFIKICGITQEKSLHAALDNGADVVGFIFVPISNRCIDLKTAKYLAQIAHNQNKKVVAVFQDQPLEEINTTAQQIQADFVQLHGSESVSYCTQVLFPIIKTMKPILLNEDVLREFRTYQSIVQYFLLDRIKQGQGELVSSSLVISLSNEFNIILAGGLTPENIGAVCEYSIDSICGYDVSSGVESKIGMKGPDKVKSFIKVVRNKIKHNSLTIVGTTQLMEYNSSKEKSPSFVYLGGNGVISSLAASKHSSVNYISVVGNDIDDLHLEKIFEPNINIDEISHLKGNTFKYKVTYDSKNQKLKEDTIEFGVYKNFMPLPSEKSKRSQFVLLSGSRPQIGLHFLRELYSPKIIAVDTMQYHLEHNFEASIELIKFATHLFMNDQEFEFLKKRIQGDFFEVFQNLQYIFKKKGENGLDVVTSNKRFSFSPPKVIDVINPVNAGDTISGTVMGMLSSGFNLEHNLEDIIFRAQLEASKVLMNDPFYRKEIRL